MKFKQYLTENKSKLINSLIQENCKPYLKLIKGKTPLYRGMDYKNNIWGDILTGQKKVRTDRKPRSHTPLKYFKIINTWLEKNGHNRRDNTVICINDKTRLAMFGAPYKIFPLGKISYTWVDSHDFNITDNSSGWQSGMFNYLPYIKAGKEAEDRFNKDYKLKMSKPVIQYFHTDDNFDKGYNKKYEFWIKCKSYYYVSDLTGTKWDKNKQIFL